MRRAWINQFLLLASVVLAVCPGAIHGQAYPHPLLVEFESVNPLKDFPLVSNNRAATIYLDKSDQAQLGAVVEAFARDVESVSGARPLIVDVLPNPEPADLIVVGIADKSPMLRRMSRDHQLSTAAIHGKWEAAVTAVLNQPMRGVDHELVIAGSDRRGASYALFTLSRQMGVSPWNWWADVPIVQHSALFIRAGRVVQSPPSVQYRGIFLNDEDWGLRPWAAKNMDPEVHNIGPHTYDRVFELLLRLHANSLWPAMHPGTLAFNALPENAKLADKWGIVMGSSHSEALLRDNVGEWSEAPPPKGNGPWNYQTNRSAMMNYWDQRLITNGRYENFYTIGLRGVHDTGLEAVGDDHVKARLVEQVMDDQRHLLQQRVNPNLASIPQVIWLYKESLELYRAGMKVPPDVTLGWTDDNYGYIRQLPTAQEQQRPGGSGLYYHVSYYGFPHDYLWLCSTPPALMHEELTKAYDHGVRKYWVLNVGDLKPAESDIDYFMQMATDEPAMTRISQHQYLTAWLGEQFPGEAAKKLASLYDRYYQLNFIRKPEFMGFNGYNDDIHRTDFNPNAWPPFAFGQNSTRLEAWQKLAQDTVEVGSKVPIPSRSAWFELVAYPIEAAAAMNAKFLFTDRTYIDAKDGGGEADSSPALANDTQHAQAAYEHIQTLTEHYNTLKSGKWSGMMSDSPRDRHVFDMPRTATHADANAPVPEAWKAGPSEATVSINATHYTRRTDGPHSSWQLMPELGISPGGSIEFGNPGLLADQPLMSKTTRRPALEYEFTARQSGLANLSIYLLPTFPVDSAHRQRFAAKFDDLPASILDTGSTGEWHEDSAPVWAANVLRNSAIVSIPLGMVTAGTHKLRLEYIDPGVIFEQLVINFPGAAPAYPVPPESDAQTLSR